MDMVMVADVANDDTTSASASSARVIPIRGLTPPHMKQLTICGCVTMKRAWRHPGYPWQLELELTDELGDRVCVRAFEGKAIKWKDSIQRNKLYHLSAAQVVRARDSNKTGQECELVIRDDTLIELCSDQRHIPLRLRFQWTKFNQLPQLVNKMTDVICVVIKVGEMKEVTLTKTWNYATNEMGKQVDKRDLQLLDDTGHLVSITLWQQSARCLSSYDTGQEPFVAVFRNVIVKQFKDVISLLTNVNTKIELNPTYEDASILYKWYQEHDHTIHPVSPLQSLIPLKNMNDVRLIDTARQLRLGMDNDDNGTVFKVVAYVIDVGHNNALYKACTELTCRKKVVADRNANFPYRCDKCHKSSSSFRYRLQLSVEVCDLSGTHWLKLFDDQAVRLLQVRSADDLGRLFEHNPREYRKVLDDILYQQFVFVVRAKVVTYNLRDRRMEWDVVGVGLVAPSQYDEMLQKTIRAIQRVPL